jgi:hypothetical protein
MDEESQAKLKRINYYATAALELGASLVTVFVSIGLILSSDYPMFVFTAVGLLAIMALVLYSLECAPLFFLSWISWLLSGLFLSLIGAPYYGPWFIDTPLSLALLAAPLVLVELGTPTDAQLRIYTMVCSVYFIVPFQNHNPFYDFGWSCGRLMGMSAIFLLYTMRFRAEFGADLKLIPFRYYIQLQYTLYAYKYVFVAIFVVHCLFLLSRIVKKDGKPAVSVAAPKQEQNSDSSDGEEDEEFMLSRR